MNEILTVIIRATFAYLLLILLARFMGRKAISQMTFFHFGVAAAFGTLIANVSLGTNTSSPAAVSAVVTFPVLAVITGLITLKSIKFRKFVNSEPIVLVENGTIVNENLKKARLTINELNTLLREKNAFNLADVEFAIFENDGELSVLNKSYKQPLTPADMNMQTPKATLPKDIIMDGTIMYENLGDANLDEQWLVGQLSGQGIIKIQDVFYAGLDPSGNLFISKKNNNSEKHGKYGIE